MEDPADPARETDRLRVLHALGLLDTGPEPVLDAFTALAAQATGLPVALLSLVDADRVWAKSAVGLAQGSELPRELSFCAHAIEADGLFEVEDARADPRFAGRPLPVGVQAVHYAGAPLRMPGGHCIGTLCVIAPAPGRLDARARATLQGLADAVVQVLVLREDDHQARARLRAKRQMLELALEASGQGLWEYWPEEDRVILSETWARSFGFRQPRELAGRDLATIVAPEAVRPLFEGVRDLVRGRSRKFALEYQQQDAHGGLVWVCNEAQVAERSDTGRVVRVVGLVRNISAAKELEQRLTEAALLAEKASRAKGDFLATMSHEIRTPINGVIGLSRMLSAGSLPPQQARYVHLIDSCAKTLLGLVDNILDFSKIEAGQMSLERADTHLPALLRETCDVFEARAADKGLAFALHADPALPTWVLTDPLRLRQILLNLLGNALKFTARGGISLHASVLRLGSDEMLALTVRDTGIGIGLEAQQGLFQPYMQASVSTYRDYRGTGLGLSISREIAHLMGGTITVESEPGQGSSFTVTLPLLRTCEQPNPDSALPPRHARADALIVLAEDDAINQMVAGAVLQELGYDNVRIAADGEEALALCERERVDIVLMDCNMPRMDGLTATRHLRERGFAAPVIALTAGATLQDRQDCLEAGMNDYLTKPMEPAVLAHALNRWLAPV